MTEIPTGLSPLSEPADGVLAAGPFVVTMTGPDGSISTLGVNLVRADAASVEWTGKDQHVVHPAEPPAITDSTITFTQAADGTLYRIRAIDPGDGVVAGLPDWAPPADPAEAESAVLALAQSAHDQLFGDPLDAVQPGEDNLYLTRSQEGTPLALIKMASSHDTLLRDSGGWRQLTQADEHLLGATDIPVRDGAVLAWDSGDLRGVNRWVSDDRFSPADASELLVELDENDHVSRLLLRRSRNRFYSRENGQWVSAAPDPAAATVDVTWSAIGAWDDGLLMQLAQVEPYDVDGEAA